jgi:hypothetical protein
MRLGLEWSGILTARGRNSHREKELNTALGVNTLIVADKMHTKNTAKMAERMHLAGGVERDAQLAEETVKPRIV